MPIYNLPVGFTLGDLHHPAGSAIIYVAPGEYSFVAGSMVGKFTLTDTQIAFPDDTDPAVLTFVQNQLAQVGQPKPWEIAIDDLRSRAVGMVGVEVWNLTAAQRLTVAALLMWNGGILDNNLKIRPIDQWLKRRRKRA